MLDLTIDPDIRRARTLPAKAYSDPGVFARARERIFARSWHFVGDVDLVQVPGAVHPFFLLEGYLDEPLFLVRDRDDQIHCLSNVCTHRGNLLVEHPGHVQQLRCRYHGRRFDLDGRFRSMPECEEALDFPSPSDDLPRSAFGRWGPFLFAGLEPAQALEELTGDMQRRLAWLPLDDLTFDPLRSRDYLVQANWALYCENYLEGFHIPYVHQSLAAALDYGSYRTELYRYATLQLGIASGDEEIFSPPPGSPDHGERIAAYYYWLFPNTMFNVYPWGVSVNVVRPLGPERTRVSFLTWVMDPAKLDRGAGAGLDRVEREDEKIVENVQRGVRSRLYDRGRYSPTRETGVHHFHRLLAEFLA